MNGAHLPKVHKNIGKKSVISRKYNLPSRRFLSSWVVSPKELNEKYLFKGRAYISSGLQILSSSRPASVPRQLVPLLALWLSCLVRASIHNNDKSLSPQAAPVSLVTS